MLVLNDDNFEKEVINYKGKVIIDFYADWCGPCKLISPALEAISKEIKSVKFAKVNVDDSPNIAGKFDVRSIPTLVVISDGKELDRIIGVLPKDTLKAKIEEIIG